jgi:hypothetical protein
MIHTGHLVLSVSRNLGDYDKENEDSVQNFDGKSSQENATWKSEKEIGG